MTTALLSSTYFGPVQWYQKLLRYDRIYIEQCDSFVKQTYRNRCLIATTSGVQALTVPVARIPNSQFSIPNSQFSIPNSQFPIPNSQSPIPNSQFSIPNSQFPIHNYRISDHGNWRHLHWQALQSAYGESPFFEYYEDDLRPFFTERWEYLYDFNEAIRLKMCELLDIQPAVELTTVYRRDVENDFREAIRPKHPLPDAHFHPRRYYQVYEQRHGFLPNLSILDLLLNMGPESIFWLISS